MVESHSEMHVYLHISQPFSSLLNPSAQVTWQFSGRQVTGSVCVKGAEITESTNQRHNFTAVRNRFKSSGLIHCHILLVLIMLPLRN